MRGFLGAVVVAVLVADLASGSSVGGWQPIKNLKDPHVAEIAEYAVAQYDEQAHAGLKLKRVVKGETQVVSGTNYRLVLEVKDGAATKDYEAVVWEKPWLHFRNLTSFRPISG